MPGAAWRGRTDNQTHYKADAKHGAYVEYDAHGAKEEEGQYKAGKREGLCTDYRRDGTREKTRMYKRGVREGPSSKYNSEGQRTSVERYQGGKKHGLMKYWRTRDGELVLQRTQEYRLGRRHGVETRYFSSGEPRYQYTYDKDQRAGPSKEWILSRGLHYVSAQGDYQRGKREGVWKHTDRDGHLTKEARYARGKLQGRSRYWKVNRSGERYLRRVAHFKAGKKHGVETLYKPDGSVKSEVSYAMGKRQP